MDDFVEIEREIERECVCVTERGRGRECVCLTEREGEREKKLVCNEINIFCKTHA